MCPIIHICLIVFYSLGEAIYLMKNNLGKLKAIIMFCLFSTKSDKIINCPENYCLFIIYLLDYKKISGLILTTN